MLVSDHDKTFVNILLKVEMTPCPINSSSIAQLSRFPSPICPVVPFCRRPLVTALECFITKLSRCPVVSSCSFPVAQLSRSLVSLHPVVPSSSSFIVQSSRRPDVSLPYFPVAQLSRRPVVPLPSCPVAQLSCRPVVLLPSCLIAQLALPSRRRTDILDR